MIFFDILGILFLYDVGFLLSYIKRFKSVISEGEIYFNINRFFISFRMTEIQLSLKADNYYILYEMFVTIFFNCN